MYVKDAEIAAPIAPYSGTNVKLQITLISAVNPVIIKNHIVFLAKVIPTFVTSEIILIKGIKDKNGSKSIKDW